MKKLTLQNKRYLLARARSQLKKKSRHNKLYIPNQRFLPASGRSITYLSLLAPPIFNLQYENVNEVLLYIAKIKATARKGGHGLFIDFSEVVEIGEGAIAMLLTVMDEYLELNRDIPVRGNQPKSEVAKEILEKSGFFKVVKGHVVSEQNRNDKNTIFTKGNAGKSQTFLPKIIHQSMETVWGVKGRNPLLYTVAFEMVRNSCDHAFRRDNLIKWYLSTTHLESTNLVKFSFADNGKGILKTLNEGKLEKVKNLFKDNVDILETAFKDGIKSRTGLSWRGKGLPTIFENYDENYIRNLIVISNDVFIDFDRKINEKLSVPFDGTYYFWIVDQNCVKANFPL